MFKSYSTFLGVQINLHSGVATGVKNLASVDLQDGHGSGSAEETKQKNDISAVQQSEQAHIT